MNSLTTTLPRFSSANGAVNFRSRTPLELDQLRRLAPSIFAERPHGSRSDRYTYIPTSEILAGLMAEGFQPFSVMQGGTRDAEKKGFTKHLIRLRHQGTVGVEVGGTFPEIVLLNSHDGTSSYRLMGGLYRLICSNGMVVADTMISDVRIPHKGDQQAAVIDGCITLLDEIPRVMDSVQTMRALTLSPAEQSAFAAAALVARYDGEQAPITPDQVIRARRAADSSPSLWHVFNRAQENLTQGGVRYFQRDGQGRIQAERKTRPINGIDQNTTVNRALHALAQEMAKIKSAA
jgi:hypothetical protein